MEQKLKIEYVSPQELKTYANNAKIHTAEQVEQIKESIKQFGFNDPIAVWKENEIIEGHGRLIAALEMDLDKVPIIRLDKLTDEERRAYTLAHNKLTMNTGFDLDVLEDELATFSEIDMSQFGFEQMGEELAELSEEATVPSEPSFSYHEQYGVIVMCKDEREQEEVFNRLTGEGFSCKVVTV